MRYVYIILEKGSPLNEAALLPRFSTPILLMQDRVIFYVPIIALIFAFQNYMLYIFHRTS